MARKKYDWGNGAPLLDHTARKLKVLGEYFAEYLRVRCCNIPMQGNFRLAVVDGFSGGGRYSKGEMGSPLVFLDVLGRTMSEIDIKRAADGFKPLEYECYFLFNDENPSTTKLLDANVAPLLAELREKHPNLTIIVHSESRPFSALYPAAKAKLEAAGMRNVIFNIDQCGDVGVDRATIVDILQTFNSAEVFVTFMIESLLAYLSAKDSGALQKRLAHLDLPSSDLEELRVVMNRREWLSTAERIVFDQWASVSPFVSPFSIHNPDGWRYWLMHFAKSPRARQVYNDVLHANANSQAHFGRAGLDMFSFDPKHEGALYLFDFDGRARAREQLFEDVPRTISGFGDAITVSDFQHQIYSRTPAHSDDIRSAIFNNPDVEVLTPSGNPRRSELRLRPDDVLRVARQRSMFKFDWPTGSRKPDRDPSSGG